MNGKHLPKIDRGDWRLSYKSSPHEAVRRGTLPARPCRECKHRYRHMILDTNFKVKPMVCTRCDIRWPLDHKKWKFW